MTKMRCLGALGLMVCSAAVAEPAAKPVAAKPAAEPAFALAIVYSGWEIWDGNDHLAELSKDDPSRYPGALDVIKDAVAKADLAHKAPAGSQAAIITYGDQANVRLALAPIAKLTPDALGSQKDFYNHKGSELVRGITAAFDQLDKSTAPRKRLIVLSDGNDTNNEAAKQQLLDLKKRGLKAGVAVTSLVWKSALSGDADLMPKFSGQSKLEATTAALGADLLQALQHAPELPGAHAGE